MASEFWEWLTALMDKSTERVREWTKHNMERRKEINRKAAAAYYERKKENDPEYIEKRKKANAEQMKKAYKPSSELSPEELEARRKKNREAVKRYREAQKAKKAAEQQNGPA